MKLYHLILILFATESALKAQLPIINDSVVSNEPVNCSMPKFIVNDKNEIQLVYLSNDSICYDLFTSDLQKVIEHQLLYPIGDYRITNFKITNFLQDQFTLLWLEEQGMYWHLYGQVFSKFGIPLGGTVPIAELNTPDFYVSEFNKGIDISYNNGEYIVTKLLKADHSLSDEVELLNIADVSQYFCFAVDFLPNNEIVLHWSDYSVEVFTKVFNRGGKELTENTLFTFTKTPYIVVDIDGAHNKEGEFYAVWPENTNSGSLAVFAQKFSKEYKRDGSVQQISEKGNSVRQDYNQVVISCDKDGDAIICWPDIAANSPAISLFAQHIDRNNNIVGSNFQVTKKESAYNLQEYSPIIALHNDQLITCWENYDDNNGSFTTINIDIQEIDDGNIAPEFISGIPDQYIAAFDTLFIKLDDNEIYDADFDDIKIKVLFDTMTVSPSWISYQPVTNMLMFTPENDDCGLYEVKLIASDPKSLSDTSIFDLQVTTGRHNVPLNGDVVEVDNSEQQQFILNVENASVCQGDTINTNGLISTLNRQEVRFLWRDSRMENYIAQDDFNIKIIDNTWIAIKSTDEFNCTRKDTIWVSMLPSPEFQFSIENNSDVEQSTTLNVSGTELTYLWGDGTTGESIVIDESGWYHVVAENVQGCTSTDSLYLTITDLGEINRIPNLRVYPNPTRDILFIELGGNGTNSGFQRIIVYNSKGEIVLEKIYNKQNTSSISIDLGQFSQGIYLISVTDKNHNRSISKIMLH